jgi:uncharacterized protein (TIGR02599 family)
MKLSLVSTASKRGRGFSLLELLISTVVLAVILTISSGVINEMQRTWSQNNARIEQFREARVAFENIVNTLRQATLNSYTTYRYNNGDTPTIPATRTEAPIAYIRHSELQFICGGASTLFAGNANAVDGTHAVFFQAPLGISGQPTYKPLKRLLNSCGYFILHGDDAAYRPEHITTSRHRFRLMEFRQPSEENGIYSQNPGAWFRTAVEQGELNSSGTSLQAAARPLAQNIIGLWISPRSVDPASPSSTPSPQIATNYHYDSSVIANATANQPQGTQHLLPDELVITMIAIDEPSGRLLADRYGASRPQLFAQGAFSHVGNYVEDLEAAEAALIAEKLSYRIFTTTVALANTK